MPSFRIFLNRFLRPVLFLGVSLFLTGNLKAQLTTLSPYSRFGPGELLFNGFSSQRAMGGAAIAGKANGEYNFLNPAAYAGDSLMVFEFGLSGERLWQRQSDVDAVSSNSRLEYFAIGLPFKRDRWGFAFGFVPFSGTGYDVVTSTRVDSLNSFSTEYAGSGGINRFFISNGVRLYKGLSLGMNVSFLYGTTDRSRIIRYSDDNFFDSRIVESTNVSDFRFELGVLWRHKLQNNSGLNFGATCGLTTSANASRSVVWDNFKTNSFGVDVVKDTVLLLDSEKGVIELPLSIGFGLQWHDAEHWIVLTDFRMKDWRGTKAFGESIPQLNRSYRISAGAEYTNDSKASSYLRKIHYRAGFYHARTNILLRERHIDEYGLTIGCGLPLRKAYQSQFSFALEAGQRGTTLSDLVQERFIRLVLGLTFNEGWFQKRRYD